eukprot:gene37158-44489_t
MVDALVPASDEELLEMIAGALDRGEPLAPVGLGTKSGIGRPVPHRPLDLSWLSGITLYEPEELTLSVRAGTPVDEIVALLAEHGQELHFEPPSWREGSGNVSGGSLGGLVMSNMSGPRRIKAGAMRDHVLGLKG